MKIRIVVTSLALFLCLSAVAQDKIRKIELSEVTGSAPIETKKEILAINAAHSKAVFDQDVAALDRLLADNWAYTNERGEVLSKAQWINNIKNRKFGMINIIHDDIRMDQFGDTVTVMGRSTSSLRYKDKISNGPRRFMLVFVKMNGEWKLVAHFVSLVPKD